MTTNPPADPRRLLSVALGHPAITDASAAELVLDLVHDLTPTAVRCEACGHTLSDGDRPIVETGPLRIDFDDRRVRLGGRPLHLTPNETGIVMVLAGRLGRLCSHRLIVERVWGPTYLDDANHLLQVNLTRIRGKLGKAADLIENRYSHGWVLRDLPPCGVNEVPRLPTPEHAPPGRRMELALEVLSEASPEWVTASELGRQVFGGTWPHGIGKNAYRIVARLVACGVPIEIRRGELQAASSFRLLAPYRSEDVR